MSEHETITINAGERYVYHLDDGETFENVLFDQRAAGAAATLIAKGTDWTIRNVGWLGPFGHEDRALGVCDSGGGTSVIENVYLGDGVEGGIGERRHPMFGLWVDPDHTGTLNIRRTYVEGAHDNGFYASAPGGSATVNFTNCYAKDNWVAGFRLANGTVRNCVAVNSSSGRDGRPIWVWNGGEVDIVNCHFDAGGYPHSIDLGRPGGSTTVNIENTQYNRGTHRRIYEHPDANVTLNDRGGNGSNPQDVVPTGCPQDAEAAAGGEWDEGGSEPAPPQEYEVIEVGANEHFRYDLSRGETWENKLIDITAPHASFTIFAREGDWTIRNIGIRGEYDSEPPHGAFLVESDGHATMDNIYLADGTAFNQYNLSYRDPTGVYVYWTHSGQLDIRRMHCTEMADQGIYGSPPGNSDDHPSPGNDGVVTIEDSYFDDNLTNVRLGTDGSYVENSAMVNSTNSRGYWGYYQHTQLTDCDIFGNSIDVVVSHDGGAWDGQADAQVTLDNCYWESDNFDQVDSWKYSGTSIASPHGHTAESVGAPTSAEEAAGGGGYNEIVVGAGETFSYTLSDGETWGDVLIDVTASGAAVDLSAFGSDWTIRNVGVRGSDAGQDEVFMIGCGVDSGSTGVIENVYLGDGDDGTSAGDGEAAIYVTPSHAGTLEVRNAYIEGHTDNGIYASDPGHEGSGGGEVHVYNTYSSNNTNSNIRLGTDGSFIENCCIWGGPHRGFWGYFEHTEVRNSHIGGMDNPDRAIEVGEPAHDKSADAEVTVTGSYFEGYTLRESSNELHGSSQGEPTEFVPDGCPTSPESAASGGGTSPPDFGDWAPPDDDSGGWSPPDDVAWNEPDEPQIDWPSLAPEVVDVGDDEHLIVEIGEHETLENVVYVCDSSNSGVTIRARGRRWEINNVAVYGSQDHPDVSEVINAGVPSGSSATIENVWLDGGGIDAVGIRGHRLNGTLHVRDTNFGGWDTAVDTLDQSGRTRINRCHFSSCEVGASLDSDGDDVAHSVFDVPQEGYAIAVHDVDDPTAIVIEDSDFTYADLDDAAWELITSVDGGTATIVGCRFSDGHDPDDDDFDIVDPDASEPITSPPTGVPRRPQDTFGRTTPWRRPARRRVYIRNAMVRGAEEYGIRAGSGDPQVRTIVENCVVDVDGVGLIADTGEVIVRNCDIRGDEADRRTANGGEITSINTRWGDDAVIEPPEGVPLSAQEASFH